VNRKLLVAILIMLTLWVGACTSTPAPEIEEQVEQLALPTEPPIESTTATPEPTATAELTATRTSTPAFSVAGGLSSNLYLVNTSERIIAVYWMNLDGQEEYRFSIPADKSHELATYVEHIWRIRDEATGSFLEDVLVKSREQKTFIDISNVDELGPTIEPTNTLSPSITPTYAYAIDFDTYRTKPLGGEPVEGFEIFDNAIVKHMAALDIESAVFVINRRDDIVYERSYGYLDQEKTYPLQPHNLFRIASISKPITLATLQRLIRSGDLRLTDRAFCVEGSPENCILTYAPARGRIDPRVVDITVKQLMDQKSGWTNYYERDPVFGDAVQEVIDIFENYPPSADEIIQYTLGQPLEINPGTTYVYTNVNFVILGRIIEAVTGQSFKDAVQSVVFDPIGINDVQIGSSLPEGWLPIEVDYPCHWTTDSAYKPNKEACWSAGGWNLEAGDAAGGFIASARSLAVFLNDYCLYNGGPRTNDRGCWGWYNGTLDGTMSFVYQRRDGVDFVLLFNNRSDDWTDDEGPDWQIIFEINDLLDDFKAWP